MTLSPFVIDCDTGRDDALAIWIALNLKLPLQAVISSYGNTVLENVIENNRRVLALGKATDRVRLYTGAADPATNHRGYQDIVLPRQEVSGNGLCNLELPVAPPDYHPSSLSKLQNDEALDYIITGPATNFATLLQERGKAFKDKIGSVTMMGGKFALWDQIPGADFNIVCDPQAIKTIFDHDITIRFVPMDATWPIALTLEEIEKLVPETDIAQTAKELMIAHCRHFAPEPVFRFHDPSVIMACLNPEAFTPVKLSIVLDAARPDYARLLDDENGYKAEIFNPDNKIREQFLDKMLEALGFSS